MNIGTPHMGGTHHRMAPELSIPGRQSIKGTYVYALGLVAYEVSTIITQQGSMAIIVEMKIRQ